MWAAHITGRLARDGIVREAAEAALRAPRSAPPPRVSDLLLDGLATGIVRGYPAGVPMLKQVVAEFRHQCASRAEELRWLWAASVVTRFVWDDESQDVLSARHVELGRQTGVLAGLPIALSARIVVHTIAGELTAADHMIEELLTLSDVMRIPMQLNGRLVVAAWRGLQEEASALIDAAVSELEPRGEGGALAVADYARAVLANGLGRYSEALTAAAATDAFDVDGFTIYAQGLSELIEAAARAGAAERAADALRRLTEMTQASGTDWGRACGPGPRRCSARMTRPRLCTGRRSSGSAGPGSASSWRALTCSTGSGCAARTAASTRVSTCAPPTTCSATWAWRPSPNEPGASCARPARRLSNAPPGRPMC